MNLFPYTVFTNIISKCIYSFSRGRELIRMNRCFQTTHVSKSRKFFVFTVCKNRFDTQGEGRCAVFTLSADQKGSSGETQLGTGLKELRRDVTVTELFTCHFSLR